MRSINQGLAHILILSGLLSSLVFSVEKPLDRSEEKPVVGSVERPQPAIALDSAWMTHQWQAHVDHEKVASQALAWSEGSLVITLVVTSPAGFRIIGQPTTHMLAAHDAAGVDLRLPHAPRGSDNEIPSLEMQSTRFVQLHLRAPVAPFSGLRELAGTCTMRLARNQPKDAVLSPLSEWIAKPANLADDKSTEFTVVRGEDGRLSIELNASAAERFAGLRLTTADGDDLPVDSDADVPDDDQQTITRTLPDDTPDNATLTLQFVGSGERRTVPFAFTPVSLPMPPASASTPPKPVPLTDPKPAGNVPVQATDGKF